MSTLPTVSDTKRKFYQHHTRPIHSVYRQVVEELLVEMHLLSVNVDFSYDPIYALGIVSTFDRFMEGYRPDADKTSIFEALCRSTSGDPQQYRQDSERIGAIADGLSGEEMTALLTDPESTTVGGELRDRVLEITRKESFKYSRLFGIGLFNLLERSDAKLTESEKERKAALEKIGDRLGLPQEKLIKDLELYRGNLEKMRQARQVIAEAIASDRKKREEREQQKATSNEQ